MVWLLLKLSAILLNPLETTANLWSKFHSKLISARHFKNFSPFSFKIYEPLQICHLSVLKQLTISTFLTNIENIQTCNYTRLHNSRSLWNVVLGSFTITCKPISTISKMYPPNITHYDVEINNDGRSIECAQKVSWDKLIRDFCRNTWRKETFGRYTLVRDNDNIKMGIERSRRERFRTASLDSRPWTLNTVTFTYFA